VQQHYEKIVSLITSHTQRDWVPDVNILHGETFKDNLLPITSGLGETTMMAPDNPPEWMEAVARVVTDHGKRLFFAVHSAAEVGLAERWLSVKESSKNLIAGVFLLDMFTMRRQVGWPLTCLTRGR